MSASNVQIDQAVKQEVKLEAGSDGNSSAPISAKTEKCSSAPADGMFSEAYYERTGWNLNNLAASQGSVLKYLQVNDGLTY